MSDIGIDMLKDSLGDEADGLKSMLEKWGMDDFKFELKWAKGDRILIVVTDVSAQEIEVFEIDIKRLI